MLINPGLMHLLCFISKANVLKKDSHLRVVFFLRLLGVDKSNQLFVDLDSFAWR
jgi:hypothetical protein